MVALSFEMSKTRDRILCDYPRCSNPAEFTVSTPKGDLHLCHEHHRLFQFIELLLEHASIEINLRRSYLRPEEWR